MANLADPPLVEPPTGLVTGSSSGIGLAMARQLLADNDELHLVGLSRRPGPLCDHPRFTHWPTDLASPELARKRALRFLQEHKSCHILIHAAGRGLFSPSTDWSHETLQDLVSLNLTSPMVLCGTLTQCLRKNQALVVFVGSTSSRERAPLGAAYAATKAGLHRFSENYFQENRKHGVRVLHLCPGMSDTDFHAQESFEPSPGDEFSIKPSSLAELVQFFFRGSGRGLNPTHLVLEPQKVGIRKTSTNRRSES
jgi:uncharacterized protein